MEVGEDTVGACASRDQCRMSSGILSCAHPKSLYTHVSFWQCKKYEIESQANEVINSQNTLISIFVILICTLIRAVIKQSGLVYIYTYTYIHIYIYKIILQEI